MTELDDELRFHVEKRIAEFMAKGATREEAERLAHARLGNVRDLTEFCNRMDTRITFRRRMRQWAGDLRLDLSQGVRQIRRTPATALAIVLTLGLGVGSTTATYAVVHKLLISPLPGLDPDRIVRLSRTNAERTLSVSATPELAAAWREGVPSLEAVAMYATRDAVADLGTGTENVAAGVMTADFPSLLGFSPAIGRALVESDSNVVLLTDGVWRRRFGARREVIGDTITIDGQSHTIIGVLPRQFVVPFAVPPKVDVWIPLALDGPRVFPNVVARLRPGTNKEALQRELDAILTASSEGQTGRRWVSMVSTARDDVSKGTAESVWVLFGAVALVLLAGCANVANLLLARAQSRQREFVIRQSLGASRARIFRQLLTESVVLSAAGWALSLLVAVGCLQLARGLRPEALLVLDSLSIDARLIAVSLIVSVVTTLLFGLAPAALAARQRLAAQLRRHTLTATADRGVGYWRGALVVIEVALSVVLLIGGGLLARTLVEMHRAPVGFAPAGLLVIEMNLAGGMHGIPVAGRVNHGPSLAALLERVKAMPGITDATWALGGPTSNSISVGILELEGQPRNEARLVLGFNMVRHDYFAVTGSRIIDGRTFEPDQAHGEVVMVSAALARRHWPHVSAVGKRLRLDAEGPWSTVVGVVEDITMPRTGGGGFAIDQVVYKPFDEAFGNATLIVRGTPAVAGLLPAVMSAAAEVDPTIKVGRLQSAETAVAASQTLPRFIAGVLAAFSVMSVLLAAIGLYGVIAHTVTRRWREMGIRRALGARTTEVLRPVMIEGGVVIVGGLIIGLAGAAAATRGLRSLLFQVAPIDVPTFAAASTALMLVAMVAVYIPARRATRVDPATVLREE